MWPVFVAFNSSFLLLSILALVLASRCAFKITQSALLSLKSQTSA